MADTVELATAYLALVPSMAGAQGVIAQAITKEAGIAGDAGGKEAGGRFGGALKGALPIAAIGATLGGAFTGFYKAGAVFDDVSDTIRVGTGATGEALAGLEDDAKRVAATIPTSFEQAGATVSDLNTRLGLSGETLQTVAKQYLEAGRILDQDVDVQKTTAAFSAFRIEGDAVEGGMDDLFRVSQATGVGMNELASGVQTVAPALQNLGFGFGDSVALMGTLDKAGLNATAVLGSMSKGMITLAKDGEEPQAAFKRVTGEIQGFVAAGDTAGALDLAGKVFGTKGAAQFVGAIQSGKINLDDLMGSAGTTEDTILGVGKATADFGESWTIVKNNALLALEPLGTAVFNLAGNGMGFLADQSIELGPKIAGGFEQGIEAATDLFSIIKTGEADGGLAASLQTEDETGLVSFLQDVRGGVIAIYDLVIGGDFTTGFQKAFDIDEDAPIVGFLLGVRDGAITLFEAIGPLAGQVLDLWTSFSPLSLILQAIQPILPALMAAFGGLAATVGGLLVTVLSTLMTVLQPIAEVLIGALTGAFSALLPVIPVIATILATLIGVFAQLLTTILPPLLAILGPLVEMLVGQLGSAITTLIPIVLAIATTLGDVLGQVLLALAPLIALLAGFIGQLLQAVLPLITPILSLVAALLPLLEPIIQLVGALLTPLIGLLTALLVPILALITPLIDGLAWALGIVIGVLAVLIDWIVKVISFFVDLVTGAGTAGDDLVAFFEGLPDMIGDAFEALGQWLLDAGGAVWQMFVDGLVAAASGIGDVVGDLMGGVADFFPHSPAKRGPFSGSGWTGLRTAGEAIGDQFAGGLEASQGVVGAQMDALLTVPDARTIVPAIGLSDALARTAVADQADLAARLGGEEGGPLVEQHIHTSPGMSEETVGTVAANAINYELRGA
ncbi:phage tail tape measure protein [Rathayibacter sp. VKM Ac-2927]|uniref:phage tail tape measure protein n=1 Tax=Rathayibacter sp. VKM Ac-2927 TaxID=2929478 RepID=UPI001FB221D4|nr:phage tail tape measure protein [Rathayibacter sp. VKM Ac-2927]MCJ1687788.1 phage tail tape measure protein [Rathayibacter sp. VKM Ac-2927]